MRPIPLFAIALITFSAGALPIRNTFRGDPQYLIDVWETEDGLPENSATAMVQAPDGYLWFGTFAGLVRFDGVRFCVFDTTNTPAMRSASIVNLHLDRGGRLWASTYMGIVSLKGNQWAAYGPAEGWPDGAVARTFAEKPDGALLITTFDGLLFECKDGRFTQLPQPPGKPGGGYLGFLDRESGRWCVFQSGFAGTWDGTRWTPLPLPQGGTPVGAGAGREEGVWVLFGDELRKYSAGKETSRRTLPKFWPSTQRRHHLVGSVNPKR